MTITVEAFNATASAEPDTTTDLATTTVKRKRTKVMIRKDPKATLVEVQEEQNTKEEGSGTQEESEL